MERLVSRAEIWLGGGGLLALLLIFPLRAVVAYALWRSHGILPVHVIVGGLLLLLLCAAGTLLPRAYSWLASLVGLACWLFALSLLLKYFWPTQYGEPWAVWFYLALGALGLILRAIYRARWLRELRGHGWEWIVNWAQPRSLFARLTALRVLRTLGWKG